MSRREVPSSHDLIESSTDEPEEAVSRVPDKPASIGKLAGAAVVGIVSAVATWFFFRNRSIWESTAEPFFSLVFGVLFVVALAYLVKRLYDRRVWQNRYG